MKSQQEFISEKVDDLALKHFGIFYPDLHPALQQSIWSIAIREYQTYCSAHIKNTDLQGGKG